MRGSGPCQSEALTHEIIGAAMEVHRCLGPGFLESIYKQALLHELRLKGVAASSEVDVATGAGVGLVITLASQAFDGKGY